MAVVFSLLLSACAYKDRCIQYKTVAEIGGCSGLCKVRYTDGTTGYQSPALKGDKVCTDRNTTFWIWQTP